jgi:hypothetical protein
VLFSALSYSFVLQYLPNESLLLTQEQLLDRLCVCSQRMHSTKFAASCAVFCLPLQYLPNESLLLTKEQLPNLYLVVHQTSSEDLCCGFKPFAAMTAAISCLQYLPNESLLLTKEQLANS